MNKFERILDREHVREILKRLEVLQGTIDLLVVGAGEK